MSGAELIAAERQRQIAVEDWTPGHDDDHTDESLALAGACYALPEGYRRSKSLGMWQPSRDPAFEMFVPKHWPWEYEAWKPEPDNRIRELVKAGALIAAEIDRLQRKDHP